MNFDAATVLPLVFMGLMGLALLIYVALDGYDLGVGVLMPLASVEQQHTMVASIGPFWDANETWLVLGVGVLLIAFPKAHGVVLGALYLPVTLMLIGLTLRGVAFDFRTKARDEHQRLWNRAFFAGSLLASLAQGWMLGAYVTGFQSGALATVFAGLIALALPATYVLLGACWLLLKTEGELQRRARRWALLALPWTALCIAAVSVVTPLVSSHVAQRWFVLPQFLWLLPIPLVTAATFLLLWRMLRTDWVLGTAAWLPLAAVFAILALGFGGLAYSLYPFVVVDQLTVWQAASGVGALKFILVGCAIALPAIAAYSIFVYRVFGGKARLLDYG
jgi:cytochrome d ubiquinol oxidase subunit II